MKSQDSTPILSVLMPVYNEARTVRPAIDDVLGAELPEFELIIIDDGSTDGTSEILQSGDWNGVRIYRHESNQGKGQAVRTALTHARGRFSAIFDADLEYEAGDLSELLTPLLRGEARAAFGVRAFNGFTSHSFLYVMGNRVVTLATNVLFNVYIGDLMSGQKVIETDLFRSLPLTAPGFDIEPEITARLVQRGIRIYEIPIRYRARSSEEGKKLTALDGLRVLRMLLRCRLSRA